MVKRVLSEDPYAGYASEVSRGAGHGGHGAWPCAWVACPQAGAPPFAVAYHLRFELEEAMTIRAHASADERYEMWLDGARVGRGSERGDGENWFFETYDLELSAGEHILAARVWSLGEDAPFAQMSVRAGWLFSPDNPDHAALVGTGVAPWQAQVLGGLTFTDPNPAWGTGANLVVDGAAFNWNWERSQAKGQSEGEAEEEGDWLPVEIVEPASKPERNDAGPVHRLRPATLPPMMEEPWRAGQVRLVAALEEFDSLENLKTFDIPIRARDHIEAEEGGWQKLLAGQAPLEIPARTRRRVLVDLGDYVCAYPELVASGGAGGLARVNWQEGLYETPGELPKGNRDEIEGKYFVSVWMKNDGVGDSFLLGGGSNRRFDTLWWQCGRFVEIVVATRDEPLILESLTLRETRYPLLVQSDSKMSDPRWEAARRIMTRSLEMCAHETYMDCPFFEQLMYLGDTRLQVLAGYALCPDDRLPIKALRMFDASRLNSAANNGLTQSRYPSRVRQWIRPFSLWHVAMVHDFALWRGDMDLVRDLLPGVRSILDGYARFLNQDGLIQLPPGPNYNFTDHVPGWSGEAPSGGTGISAPINWQWSLVLGQAAELEAMCGEPELAARWDRMSKRSAQASVAAFWNHDRGCFADDPNHKYFSEHAQCLSILSGHLDSEMQQRVLNALLEAPDLARATIYFSHYVLEVMVKLGRADAFFERLEPWFELEKLGFKTTPEMPEPTRSDCHAWGAHPLFHFAASILGVRPTSPGLSTIHFAPMLGPLESASGTIPHPRGLIHVDLRRHGGTVHGGMVHGEITLPEGVSGTYGSDRTPLESRPGTQELVIRSLVPQ